MATGDITFAVRGTALNAYRSTSGKTPGKLAGTEAVVVAGGTIGGSYLNLATDGAGGLGNRHALVYPGRLNMPTTQALSIAMRCQFKNTVAQLISLCEVSFNTEAYHRISLYWNNSAGELRSATYNDSAVAHLNNVGGAWSPAINTWYDIVLVTAGTTGVGSALIYVDGTAVATLTPGAALDATRVTDKDAAIYIGWTSGIFTSDLWVEEFVVFEGVIDPTAVTLTSGVGSLNGASRTAYIEAVAFDGTNSTDPGTANVAGGTSYVINGVAKTGSKGPGGVGHLGPALF